MIRDDQIEPERAGCAARLDASDAAVDRDDQMHPLGCEAIERRRLQSIAIPQTLGDEMDDVSAKQFERASQNNRGGDAVDVVIAVNGDALAFGDRGKDAIDRDVPCRSARTDRANRPAKGSGTGGPPRVLRARGSTAIAPWSMRSELLCQDVRPPVVAGMGLPDTVCFQASRCSLWFVFRFGSGPQFGVRISAVSVRCFTLSLATPNHADAAPRT